MRTFVLSLLLIFSQTSYAEEILFEGLGDYHRKITTKSAQAQKYFDQGMAFLFGFNHDEAIRSFTQAAKLDPKCTMTWWGLANANGPHINNPSVDAAHNHAAWEAVQKGLAQGNNETKLERALMEAMAKRFTKDPPQDRKTLDLAYAEAMRPIWKANPNDADVAVLFAESMMDLRPWDLYRADGTPQPGTDEVVDTLRAALKIAPRHPQANHLFIHAVESSLNPAEAIEPADRLRDLQPALGHMVHMPSHIDVRVGHWKKAVLSNEKAMVADAYYRKTRPKIGFYHIYMLHNAHMLAYSAMMSGQSKKALESIDAMVRGIPADWAKEMALAADGYFGMPFEVRVRFGKWNEILALPELAEHFPLARALRRATRSIALSALGRTEEAQKEKKEFLLEKARVPAETIFGNNTAAAVLAVEEHMMNGELLLAQKKMEEAVVELKEAVKAEDALRYDEPPDWMQPTRDTLGAVLMSIGKFEEARDVYETDLKKVPNNVWALYGLSQAYEKLGQKQKAEALVKQFNSVRAENNADFKIQSSCQCIAPSH